MAVTERDEVTGLIDQIERRLEPSSARADAVEELNALFATGRPPAPSGFHRGRVITTDTWAALDGAVRRVARLWMPWLGKSFDPAASKGVNVLKLSARTPLKMLWPSYEPLRETADGLEVFAFKTRVAAGELDPQTDVLKIDYDSDANPDFVIRRILDELVELEEGFFLGKILYRTRKGFQPIGFFSLTA